MNNNKNFIKVSYDRENKGSRCGRAWDNKEREAITKRRIYEEINSF